MVLLNTSYTHTRSILRGAPAVSVVLVVSSWVALICQVVVVTVRAAPVPLGNACSHWLWVSHMQMRCCEVLCEGTDSRSGCMPVVMYNPMFSIAWLLSLTCLHIPDPAGTMPKQMIVQAARNMFSCCFW